MACPATVPLPRYGFLMNKAIEYDTMLYIVFCSVRQVCRKKGTEPLFWMFPLFPASLPSFCFFPYPYCIPACFPASCCIPICFPRVALQSPLLFFQKEGNKKRSASVSAPIFGDKVVIGVIHLCIRSCDPPKIGR